MIGNDLEMSIIGLYADDLSAGYTILQIAKLLKKAYPYINKKVNEFISEGIFTKTTVGKSYLCHVNLKSAQAKVLLTLHALRALQARQISEPKFEALVQEIAQERAAAGIVLAAQFGEELALIADRAPSPQSPILSASRVSLLTQDQLRARLAQERASCVIFGFELYFTLAGEARGGAP